MTIEWQVKSFEQLTTLELYQALKLRTDVFVVEQNCPYPEIDGVDLEEGVIHVLGKVDEKVVAYGRIYGKSPVHIGRVVLDIAARGSGQGKSLIGKLIDVAEKIDNVIEIQAQAYLKNWYGKFGFKAISDEYLEDGIPHFDMQRSA